MSLNGIGTLLILLVVVFSLVPMHLPSEQLQSTQINDPEDLPILSVVCLPW